MALIITVKVIPAAGRTECIIEQSGQLKCYLKSSPEKGKANQELIKFLAQKLKVTRHDIAIISGATLRIKTIKIKANYTFDQVLLKITG
jgi:hypothetical protein